MKDTQLLSPARALEVIENDILPLTEHGVKQGNKIFGAAIVRKSDLSLVLAATNQEIRNPLWHGEMEAIRQLYKMDANKRPVPQACYFLATHEPCSLCLSAITWGGYDNFTYLFSHQQSRDDYAIPHDLRILQEVFGLGVGEYQKKNHYWTSSSIDEQIAELPMAKKSELKQHIKRITTRYDVLSNRYQQHKERQQIPLK